MVIYDDEKLELRFSRNGTDYTISCMGLPSQVFNHLVLVGAFYLLKNKKNPNESWGWIKKGSFTRVRRKAIPKVVQAYANLAGAPVHEVFANWQQLSKEQRKELLQNKEIRKAMIDL